MLIAWIMLAVGQLSAGSLPIVDLTSGPARSAGSLAVPGEPSTLIEALIGATIIVGYLVLSRRVRGRRGTPTVSARAKAGGRRKAA